MALLFQIIGPNARSLGRSAQGVFTPAGAVIGLKATCGWIIRDPCVSAEHARVHHQGGLYLLEDLSSNGVFVKSRENRLAKGELYHLRNGDRIFIDAYEIDVVITEPHAVTEALQMPSTPRQPAASRG